MKTFNKVALIVLVAGVIILLAGWRGAGPETSDMIPHGTLKRLLIPSMKRSEVLGLVAGFGTTFAALPDLLAMLRRRSTAGMNPRMAADYGRLPDPVDLLWPVDRLAAGRDLERDRCAGQFHQRRRVLLFRASGKGPCRWGEYSEVSPSSRPAEALTVIQITRTH